MHPSTEDENEKNGEERDDYFRTWFLFKSFAHHQNINRGLLTVKKNQTWTLFKFQN
ncbi:hypothetical protein YC2023_051894 [Brassica napus]